MKLSLTIYRDFMQDLFHQIFRGGQYKPRNIRSVMFGKLRLNVTVSLFFV